MVEPEMIYGPPVPRDRCPIPTVITEGAYTCKTRPVCFKNSKTFVET